MQKFYNTKITFCFLGIILTYSLYLRNGEDWMKRWKKWTLAGAAAVSLTASVYIYASARNPEGLNVRAVPVKRGNVESYMSTSGVIQSRNKEDYYVYTPTKIEKVYVNVGDKVSTNELLVKLKVPDLTPQLKQAGIQLEIAEAALENLKKLKSEGKEANSLQIMGMDIDLGQIGDIDSRIELQEKQVELANINLSAIRDTIKTAQSEIKALSPGIVTNINGADGGAATVGVPVITVEDTNSIKAVLNVSQYDVVKIKEGQEATIKTGEGQKEYKGIVERINPTAKKIISGTSAETAIPVEVSIKDPGSDIKIGFDVDVSIKTCFRPDVLYIPGEAVINSKDRSKQVFVLSGGRAALRDIETGVESDFYTEVTGGLKEGEYVIVNPPSNLKEGMAVRNTYGGESK
jgi:RND family efflux transporter, MFP subunit